MAPKVKPIPEGFHSVTPGITFKDSRKAIEFYKKALAQGYGGDALARRQRYDACYHPHRRFGPDDGR